MNDKDRIIEAIYTVIDDKNEELPENQQLDKSLETPLFGEKSKLDSLGLVNVIVATEQKIEEDFEALISLTDERAMSQKNSPFRTVGTLVEYVAALLQEAKNG